MSKMKDLFIQMQNEDWERMPLHERAIIEAERRLNEEQLWLEIMQEEQLKQAKIVEHDNQEVQENIGEQPQARCISDAGVSSGESEHQALDGIFGVSANAFPIGETGADSVGRGGEARIYSDNQGDNTLQSDK